MNYLFILNDPPYGTERSYNGMRLACGIPVGACGSCLDARGITDTELMEGGHRSSMEELTAWTREAEKVLVF